LYADTKVDKNATKFQVFEEVVTRPRGLYTIFIQITMEDKLAG
jgi:hypothetical protein